MLKNIAMVLSNATGWNICIDLDVQFSGQPWESTVQESDVQ